MNPSQLPSRRMKKLPALSLAALLTTTIISVIAGAEHKRETRAASAVSIENFGKVNDHYYRGAQPAEEEYQQLASLGVKTIIDLRIDAKAYAKTSAESSGLRYLNFPMNDKKYPAADTAQKFLAIVNNQENWPVYVHCAGGRHRTGVMTAVYRIMMDGWDMDRAYSEMKQYDFYTSWGHQAMKDYIFDFYQDTKQRETIAAYQKAAEATAKGQNQ